MNVFSQTSFSFESSREIFKVVFYVQVWVLSQLMSFQKNSGLIKAMLGLLHTCYLLQPPLWVCVCVCVVISLSYTGIRLTLNNFAVQFLRAWEEERTSWVYWPLEDGRRACTCVCMCVRTSADSVCLAKCGNFRSLSISCHFPSNGGQVIQAHHS